MHLHCQNHSTESDGVLWQVNFVEVPAACAWARSLGALEAHAKLGSILLGCAGHVMQIKKFFVDQLQLSCWRQVSL